MAYYLAYIRSCFFNFKEGMALGTFVYLIIFFTLMASKTSRRNLKLKYLAEWLFCIYGCAVLSATGLLNLSLSNIRFTGLRYSIIPIVDGVFKPMVLNFILFVPFGFLLPLALYAKKGRGKSSTIHGWTWYNALFTGLAASAVIEIIQLFVGRFAEIDDVIMNGLGALGGYALFACVHQFRKRPSKGLLWLFIWIIAVLISYFALAYITTGALPI